MIQNADKGPVRAYGKLPLIGAIAFTPLDGVDPTIVHAAGFETVTWVSEGIWNLKLTDDLKDVLASGLPFATLFVSVNGVITDDLFHEFEVRAINQSTGVIQIRHRAISYATIVSSGPAVQDLLGVSQIQVFVHSLEA